MDLRDLEYPTRRTGDDLTVELDAKVRTLVKEFAQHYGCHVTGSIDYDVRAKADGNIKPWPIYCNGAIKFCITLDPDNEPGDIDPEGD